MRAVPSTVLNAAADGERSSVTQTLRQAGFTVLEVVTGAEVLRLAAAENPELIVLGVRLPDGSGLDVCRQLQAAPLTAATAVLILVSVLISVASSSKTTVNVAIHSLMTWAAFQRLRRQLDQVDVRSNQC